VGLFGDSARTTGRIFPRWLAYTSYLLNNVLEKRDSIIVRPTANGSIPSSEPCILICPANISTSEVIELVVPAPANPQAEEQLFSMLNQACAIAAQHVPPQRAFSQPDGSGEPASTRSLTPEEIGVYVNVLNSSIDQKLTCSNAANETRRVLDCDRVSVVMIQHGKGRVVAVSGQTSVNRRSNNVQLIERLTRKILRTRSAFWYPDSDVAPQISSVLDEYLVVSATRSLIVEPIFEKPETDIEDPESVERQGNLVIGGLVFEHCNELWTRESHGSVIGFTTRHAGNAIRNARRHQQLFLYPLWNLLGKSRILTAPRVLPKTLLASVAILLFIGFLTFWKTDFYVSCDGELIPSKSRRVFSSVSGVVEQVHVEHGSYVKKDDVLIQLSSEDLELKLQRNRGASASLKKRLEELHDSRIRAPGERGDNSLNTRSIKALEAELESLENEFDILNGIVDNMTIRSPMTGMVITWDVRDRLLGRPIDQENVLMEVADVDGAWELELHLEDRKIGHFLKHVENAKEKKIRVSFILAADSARRFEGTIVEISQTAELTSDNLQSIRIRVEIDSGQLPVLQARTGVKARIVCGRTSVGFLWFHEIPEFLNKNVFFYFAN